jgi:hypothetical protein
MIPTLSDSHPKSGIANERHDPQSQDDFQQTQLLNPQCSQV